MQTDTEVIPKQAELLIAERLTEVEKNAKLYPNEADTTKILEFDKSNATVSIDTAELKSISIDERNFGSPVNGQFCSDL